MITPEAIVEELERKGVKITVAGDKLRLEAPAGVLTPSLKELIARNKAQIIEWLMNPTTDCGGKVVRLYRARPECMKAGYCLRFTNDCGLFPLTWRWGWCRERVSMARPQRKARGG
ncbi:hypothetical protein [Thermovenabulum gondwanense]|uniref:TubC N-terminal docking domain-containing protein n=3 Tax=Thermosediminibacteraceae TaxID=2770093 RepID=A0A140L7T7_9FIRM|nr:hypothetical protein [Thermovenabulum gondwanense]KXG76612.1 hypothetical protein AN618_15050 [Fervidicola ferrireducens]KYO68676.1 hypothetical protein ATZ99_01850 [Thermovenabulum gondwanense]